MGRDDYMAYETMIKGYEVLDGHNEEGNIKVSYVNGDTEILTTTTDELEKEMKDQIRNLIHSDTSLKSAIHHKGLSLLWVFISTVNTLEYFENESGARLALVFISWLNVILQFFSSFMDARSVGKDVWPTIISLFKAKMRIKKYRLYFENESRILQYLDSIGDVNMQEIDFDGTINSLNTLSYRDVKKLVKRSESGAYGN